MRISSVGCYLANKVCVFYSKKKKKKSVVAWGCRSRFDVEIFVLDCNRVRRAAKARHRRLFTDFNCARAFAATCRRIYSQREREKERERNEIRFEGVGSLPPWSKEKLNLRPALLSSSRRLCLSIPHFKAPRINRATSIVEKRTLFHRVSSRLIRSPSVRGQDLVYFCGCSIVRGETARLLQDLQRNVTLEGWIPRVELLSLVPIVDTFFFEYCSTLRKTNDELFFDPLHGFSIR